MGSNARFFSGGCVEIFTPSRTREMALQVGLECVKMCIQQHAGPWMAREYRKGTHSPDKRIAELIAVDCRIRCADLVVLGQEFNGNTWMMENF
jgi:hypothetical protein